MCAGRDNSGEGAGLGASAGGRVAQQQGGDVVAAGENECQIVSDSSVPCFAGLVLLQQPRARDGRAVLAFAGETFSALWH